VEFCRRFKKLRCPLFWKEHISFYLDGTGFVYKTKPFDQAKAPSVREWRKKSEGLKITTKGRKEGCRNANFMVGISYNCGVVLCEQYFGTVTGNKFAGIVEKSFPEALAKCSSRVKRVLQDGCPRQNSKVAREAFSNVDTLLFKIPPRSPDLNPIENFFSFGEEEAKGASY